MTQLNYGCGYISGLKYLKKNMNVKQPDSHAAFDTCSINTIMIM